MKLNAAQLLADLKDHTESAIQQAKVLREMPLELLLHRPAPQAWNALECIQHLNWYSDFYLPEISRRLQGASKTPAKEFKPTWLGNKFVKAVSPLESGAKGMKTFKDKNPFGWEMDLSILDRFIQDQEKTLKLLAAAKSVNINRVKTNISISRWIKLRLGDTFRVVVLHNQRHLEQAYRAVESKQELVEA